MALDAIKGYLETLMEMNLPIPEDLQNAEPVVEKMAVAV